jgi:cold shock CspA family protein
MIGKVQRVDAQGFGIIKASDGSKLAFIRSDFARNQSPQEGQKVVFSIRHVKGGIFASHVYAQRAASNAV